MPAAVGAAGARARGLIEALQSAPALQARWRACREREHVISRPAEPPTGAHRGTASAARAAAAGTPALPWQPWQAGHADKGDSQDACL